MDYNELLNNMVNSSWLKLIKYAWWKNKSHMRSIVISDKTIKSWLLARLAETKNIGPSDMQPY